ncbi:MAG: MBL fold metallo-hydrolase [Lachnospiraceae bacterium]|nr:MBL fold metallo-hydrolase [Lachnospiraceae bacterium]
MEKLFVLGTGNAQAIHCYNTCFAMLKNGEYFLTDAGGGNGILLALDNSGIPLEKIHHIFVTHAHSDHILGMVWMIRMIATMMNKDSYDGSLCIYCHKELIATIKTLTSLTVGKKFCRHFDERILFIPVADGETRSILGERFTFFDICSTKEKQFGFTLEMEQQIKLAFPGDEPYRENLYPYVQGAHWLLHEAFCLYDQRDRFKPYEKHHSTVKDACELAEHLGIPNLVLWHTEDKTIADRKTLYLAEGSQYYHGRLYVPEDGEVFTF